MNGNDTHDSKRRVEPLRQLDARLKGSMCWLSAVIGDKDVLHGDPVLSAAEANPPRSKSV